MKSLTEAQLHEMLEKACAFGGWEWYGEDIEVFYPKSPDNPPDDCIEKRREFFQKLIDEV